jgi:hypothetical protein
MSCCRVDDGLKGAGGLGQAASVETARSHPTWPARSDTVPPQVRAHQRADFGGMRLQGEMSDVEQVNFSIRQVTAIGVGAGRAAARGPRYRHCRWYIRFSIERLIEGRSSFLKKRSKRLLSIESPLILASVSNVGAKIRKSLLLLFFRKEELRAVAKLAKGLSLAGLPTVRHRRKDRRQRGSAPGRFQT